MTKLRVRTDALNFIAALGRFVLEICAEIGRLCVFIKDSVWHCFAPPVYPRLIFDQMVRIGYNSLPVVGLTAFFTGGVLALQIYIGGTRFNAESLVAITIRISTGTDSTAPRPPIPPTRRCPTTRNQMQA